MGGSLTRRFGPMLPRSILGLGVVAWTSSLAASRASLGAAPGTSEARRTSGGSGAAYMGSLRRFDQSGASSSVRLDLEAEGFNSLPETLPLAGMISSGLLFQLEPLEHRIKDDGCGSWLDWPTPTAQDSHGSGSHGYDTGHRGVTLTDATARGVLWPTPTVDPERPNEGNVRAYRRAVKSGVHSLQEAMGLLNGKDPREAQGKLGPVSLEEWSTPTAGDGKGRQGYKRGNPSLIGQARTWMTPRAQDSYERRPMKTKRKIMREGGDVTLPTQVTFWKTPHANSHTGPGNMGREGGENIQTQVANWMTPVARDHKVGGMKGQLSRQIQEVKGPYRQGTLPDQTTEKGGASSSTNGQSSHPRLNPRFAEWLQGLPHGWASLRPLSKTGLWTTGPTSSEQWVTAWRQHVLRLLSSTLWKNSATTGDEASKLG